MQKKYFGVNLEFDQPTFYDCINRCVARGPAVYICVVDANVLTMARKDERYLRVLNKSVINTCDGSSIAFFASKIHRKRLRALNGPDIFAYLIQNRQFKNLLLGSSSETFSRIVGKMENQGLDSSNIEYLELPFLPVEEFDYNKIAVQINALNPDLIWVSLGAPKQELFMYNILPLINHGVMFGIGAAFNFYIGEIKMTKFSIFGLRFIWINRLIADPVRIMRRLLPYLMSIPEMLYSEILSVRSGRK